MENNIKNNIDEYKISVSDLVVSLVFIPMFITSYIAKYKAFYSSIYIVALLIIFTLLIKKIFKSIKKRNTKIRVINIVWILTLFPVLFNSYAITTGEYGWTIRYLVIILFVMVFQDRHNSLNKIYKVIMYFSLFYIITTLIFNFIPIISKLVAFTLPKSNLQTVDILKAGFTNHYSLNAIYIILGFGIVISICTNEKITLDKKLILLIMSATALLFTTKRGPLVTLILTSIFTFYLYQADRPKSRIVKMSFFIFVLLIIIGGISIFTPMGQQILFRFDITSSGFMSGRDKLYELAWNLFRHNKLVGIGWGKYKHLSYLAGVTSSDILLDTHNVYLNILCETGILGISIFLIAFIYTFIMTVKFYLKARKRKINLGENGIEYLTFSLYIQTYFLIYCFTGNPLYDVQMLYPYMAGVTMMVNLKWNYIKKLTD